jgi:hypothetical protein
VGEEPLVDLVEKLGGWPVVTGTNWKGSTSVEVLLGQVRARLNMGIILELWIGPDDTNSSNNIIQVLRRKATCTHFVEYEWSRVAIRSIQINKIGQTR